MAPALCKWLLDLLRGWLGTIGSTATFTLTGVLALAAVITRFAAALAFAGILSLAGMFFGLILGGAGDLAVVPQRNRISGGGVLRHHGIAGHQTGQRGAHHQ